MFYMASNDGYIAIVGEMRSDFGEITEERYNQSRQLLSNKPTPPDDKHDYRLTVGLEWELFGISPMPEPEPTIEDKAEAYDILVGEQE